ncbi:MAG: winged helix-turn-helix domain-containing protein [Nitrososphaerales archaeon]|jgi:DNA-binding transcriptional ArsR family regulator
MLTITAGPQAGDAAVSNDGEAPFERLLWWLIAGAGGRTRLLLLHSIRERPRNAQNLSQDLGLDYTTVRHHLRVLESNRLVVAEGGKYGRVYFVSEALESRWERLEVLSTRQLRSTGAKEGTTGKKNGGMRKRKRRGCRTTP